MTIPAHVGLEHPNLLWIVVAGIMAFGAGLVANLSRSNQGTSLDDETPVSDE